MISVREESSAPQRADPGEIVDAVFSIACRSLPVDHAWALSQAIQEALPWFAHEPAAGLHTIHGAESGSGWTRPEGPDARIELSHRAKLALRLPRHRLEAAAALVGRTLDVAGSPLTVQRLAPRPLSRITTLFSRHVVLGAAEEEPAFLEAAGGELEALGVRPGRMLCGRVSLVATPERVYRARSLMVAGLAQEQSLALQRQGLGAGRALGCGLFIPHKDIADLRTRED
ncbi:MAG TPA: type I-MYXAN CRISPR-associated protein Cas6/Cmx6 [Usitatibacter sp.]|nr:type I-MYXAN CRISPR-associated protein Cas6/Cmx6 [Usitatibacter sp.]